MFVNAYIYMYTVCKYMYLYRRSSLTKGLKNVIGASLLNAQDYKV